MRNLIHFLFLFVFVALVGCGQGNVVGGGEQVKEKDPFYEGEIVEIDDNIILVSGSSESYNADQFYFHVESNTEIVGADGAELSVGELKAGDVVEIWLNKDKPEIMESYPPQAYAGKIKIN